MIKTFAWITIVFLLFGMVGATLDFSSAAGGKTVMTIGDYNVSVAVFDYFYYSTAYQYYSTYSQYYDIDRTKPYEEQSSPFGNSWAEVFETETLSVLKMYIPLYMDALKAGYTLIESEQDQIDSALTGLSDEAAGTGYTQEALLRTEYGSTMTIETFKSALGIVLMVSRYIEDIVASYTFTDEDYEEAYLAAPEKYDLAEFCFFSIPNVLADDGTEYSEAEQTAYYEKQKARAEELLSKLTTPEIFFEQTLPYRENTEEGELEDDTRMTYLLSDLSEDDRAFLGDPARKRGDTTLRDANGNFFIFLFIDRFRNEKSVDVRHILAKFDENATDAEADKAAKRKEAEAILAEWKAGAATEESFGTLATEKTGDEGSADTGGLYTNISPTSRYVKPFLDWCMQTHQPGDTGIVETTYGYHVMYFVKTNDPVWKDTARPNMENDRLKQYCDDLLITYPVNIDDDTMKYAMKPVKSLPDAA